MVDQNIITVLVGALAIVATFKVTQWYDKWKYEQSLHNDAVYRHIEEGDHAIQSRLDKVEDHLHRRLDDLVADNQTRSCRCAKQ